MMEVRELTEFEALRFDAADFDLAAFVRVWEQEELPMTEELKRNLTEFALNQTQSYLVAAEGLSVEEALTVVVAKIPEPEEPWDGVAR